MSENPLDPSNEKPWHWLYSVPWWGYTCFAFSIILVLIGLDGMFDRGQGTIFPNLIGLPVLLMLPLAGLAFTAKIRRRSGNGSDYPKPNSKWFARGLGLSFIFTMIGVSITPFRAAVFEVQQVSGQSTAEIAANEPWLQHTFGVEQFTIKTPSNWIQTDVPGFGTRGYQLSDETNQLAVVFCATPKSDVTVTSLKAVNQMAIANIKKQGANHSVKHQSSETRAGIPMTQSAVEWESGAQRVMTITRQMEFPDHWVEIDVHCSPSRFSMFEKRLTQIVDSIQRNEALKDK